MNVMLLNAQDFFVFMEHYNDEDLAELNEYHWQKLSAGLKSNKSLPKLYHLTETFKHYQCDLIFLTEIGGLESLENFTQHFLSSTYNAYSIPSNSDRGIDMGVLIRKDSGWTCKLKSYKKVSVDKTKGSKGFARDLLEVKVSPIGKSPCLVFYLVHLKSKREKKGTTDFEGRTWRQAEVETLTTLVQENFEKDKLPYFILGDFNGIATGPEREVEFYTLDKLNIHDVLEEKPHEERATFFYFRSYDQCHPMQLDYIFYSQNAKKFIDFENTYVAPFIDQEGIKSSYPTNLKQKVELPSDHFPVFMRLKEL